MTTQAKQQTTRRILAGSIAAILSVLTVPAPAATLYWDADGDTTVTTGGDGIWDTTSLFWRAGSPTGTLSPWSNFGYDNDVFLGGSTGTLTLTTGISVNDFTVNPDVAGTYTITGAQTLTLNGAAPSSFDISVGNTLSISSQLAGANGFTKTGVGTLILDSPAGTSALFGAITLTNGTLQVANSASNQALRGNAVSLASGTSLTSAGTGVLSVGALSGSGAITHLPVAATTINQTALADGTFSGSISVTTGGGLNLRGNNGTTQTFNGDLTLLTGQISAFSGANLKLSGTGDATSGVIGGTLMAPRAGTITLDNSGGNTSAATGRVLDSTGLSFVGGTFSLIGNSTADTSETVGAINLNAGAATISVTHNGSAGGTVLTITDAGALRDATGMTVNFVGSGGTLGTSGSSPRITFTGALFTNTTNGMLANSSSATAQTTGWAVVNGTSWAGNGANGIVALADTARDSSNLTSAASWELANFAPSSTTTTLGANVGTSNTVSIGALKISPTAAGQTLAVGTNNIFAPALMLTGTEDFSITGTTGGLGIGTGTRYVWVTDANTTLNYGTAFPSTGPVTKSGPGILNLSGASSQLPTANINIVQGVLRGTLTTLGGGSSSGGVSTTLNLRGGVLEISGGGTFSRALDVAGGAGGGGLRFDAGGTDKGDGGFSAIGGNATVTLVTALGGSTPSSPVWNDNAWLGDGYAFLLGTTKADSRIEFTNNIGLDTGLSSNNYAAREIRVADNTSSSGDVARLSGVISGSANADLMKTGPGVLELTGTNTYLGNTLIQQGTLLATNGAALSDSGAVILANTAGTTLQLNNGETIGTLSGGGASGGNVNLQGNTLTVGDQRDSTYAGALSGTGGAVVKQGAGVLTLTGSNSYTGGTTINGGGIKVGGANALPAGTVLTLANTAGTGLDLNGFNQTIASLAGGGVTGGNLALGAGTLTVGDATDTIFGGIISGTGGLNKVGAGKLTLSATSTYTGATDVSAGMLVIGGSSSTTSVTVSNPGTALSTGPTTSIGGVVTINSGALLFPGGDLAVGALTVGGITVNGGASLKFDLAGASSYDQVLAGAGLLTLGGGIQTIDLYGTVAVGTYTLLSYGSKAGGSFTLGVAPGGFDYDLVTGATSTVLTITAPGGSFIWDVGGGGLPYTDGAGTWSNGSTNFANTVTTNQAAWNNSGVISLTFGNGGAGGVVTLGSDVRVGSTLTFATVTTPYTIGAPGSTTFALTLGGGIAADHSATIEAPTILEVSQTFAVANSQTLTVNGVISGPAIKLTKSGAGTLLLGGANTYSGGTDITSGIVRTGAANVLPSTGTITLSNIAGAVLDLNNFNQTIGALAGGGTLGGNVTLGSATLTVGDASSTTFAGVISGTDGSLIKQGAGTLTLSGPNTYTGSTAINAGVLQAGANNTLPSTTALSLANALGAAFDLNGRTQTIGSLAGGGANGGNVTLGAGTLTVGDFNNTTYAGIISGTGGSLIKQGGATLTLTGGNTYTGSTTINAGTLLVGATNALPAASAVTIADAVGAVLDVNGNFQTIGSLAGGGTTGGEVKLGAGTLTLNGAADASFAGVISGVGGNLVKQGAATQTISGANTFTGTTLINAGFLNLGSLTTLQTTSGVTVASGGQLQLGAFTGGPYTIGGSAISLSGTGPAGAASPGALIIGSSTSSSSIVTLANDLFFAGDATIYSRSTNVLELTGQLTGSGAMTKAGPGVLDLIGVASNGIGGTVIAEGITNAVVANVLMSGPLSVAQTGTSSATLNLNASQSVGSLSSAYSASPGSATNTIAIAPGATLTINQQGTTTYGTPGTGKTSTISGGGGIALAAASTGTLVLDGSNSFSGGVAIHGGELKLNSGGALNLTGANALSLSGSGVLTLNGNSANVASLSGTSGTTLQNGGATNATLTTTATGTLTFAGTIQDGGAGTLGLTKKGSSELTLGGTNTYTGATTINGGVLRAANNASLGTSAVTLTGGKLLGDAGVMATNPITITGNPGGTGLLAGWDFQTVTNGGTAITAAPGTPTTLVANFGSGAIFLDGTNGASTWINTNPNPQLTAFGGTAVNAGPGFSTTTGGAASLALANSSANGQFVVFRIDMTGKTDLAISYATQRSGTGFNAQDWSFSTDATNWTTLESVTTIPSSFGATTLGTITGLDDASTAYIRLAVSGATASAGNNRFDNFQFNATSVAEIPVLGTDATSGTTTFGGGVTLNSSVELTAAAGGTALFSGQFQDGTTANGVSKTGGGIVILSGPNTYTGPTEVFAGQLVAANNSALGAGPVTLDGGTLQVIAGVAIGNTVSFLSESSHYLLLRNPADSYTAFLAESQLGGTDTLATFLAGTADAARALDTTFSLTSTATNDGVRVSDVFDLSGSSDDVFVLELGIAALPEGAQVGGLQGDTWLNAVAFNTGNNASAAQQGFLGSFASFQATYGTTLEDYIGAYGIDTTLNKTWAVLDYSGTFAAVPEPGTALALVSGIMLLGLQRRRRRA